ncbi:MAG TPA: hypothetical protein VEL74_00805 [Thermoanaerobaculia bacterium]|nr:hypothetical protein [Thermoanaerobaculia bacterium]
MLFPSERSPEEARDMIRRLLARVPERASEGAGEEPVPAAAAQVEPPAGAYDRAFTAAFERVDRHALDLSREHAAAAALWAELLGHDAGRRRMRVRNDRRYHSWAFCDRLLEESRKAGRSDPRRALEIAELALEAAHHLDTEHYGQERLADLLGMSWCAVGEARRLQGDREGARGALDCAREALARGTGDPLARAALAGHDASLAMDLHEYAEAAGHLDRAIHLHRRYGDPDFAGDRLVQEALRRAGVRRAAPASRASRHGRRSG